MALPVTKGMWIGVGILVAALVLIGIGTIIRTSPNTPPAATQPETAPLGQTAVQGGSGDYFPSAATSTSTSTQETAAAPTATVVSYAGTGFTPASITVKIGTTVNFENESMVAMWPASNPHPTHTDLPGFDAGKPVEAGGTYSYTFQKVGTWKYHNHLRREEGGSVTVTP